MYNVYSKYGTVCQVERLSANQLKSNTLLLVIALNIYYVYIHLYLQQVWQKVYEAKLRTSIPTTSH